MLYTRAAERLQSSRDSVSIEQRQTLLDTDQWSTPGVVACSSARQSQGLTFLPMPLLRAGDCVLYGPREGDGCHAAVAGACMPRMHACR